MRNFLKQAPRILTPFVSLLLLQGCTSPQKKGSSSFKSTSTSYPGSQKRETSKQKQTHALVPPASKITEQASTQETREFREIEALFSKGLFDLAETKMPGFEKHYPESTLLPLIENLRGLILLRKKLSTQAAYHFKRAIDLNPSHPDFNQYISYNLATAQFESNQIDDAQHTLNTIELALLDKNNRLKVHYLKATLYQKKSLPFEAIRQLLVAGKLLSEIDSPESKVALERLLNQSLQAVSELPTLEKIYQEFEDAPGADAILFRIASQEMTSGTFGSSEIHLKKLMARYPQSTYYRQAAELLTHPQLQTPVDDHSVGVLLPMTGKFSKFGSKSLQGIQLALGIFGESEFDPKINLIIEDSGDEPEQAIHALNRLVFKHHVVAIIGPMVTKGIDQISHRAQELGVPLISLARRASIPSEEYIFQAGLTQQLQAYEIARYSIQKLGLKRFAVIYPNDKLGIEISQSFWDSVESLGGKIVGIEPYRPGETDFRLPIDKLSGLYYTEARQRELDLMAQEREANHILKRTRKTEQFFNLKPVVDYDAVFIPDEPKVAGQILPTFAYRDVEGVQFLGISSWHSPDFLARAQSYAEHASFVDAFFPESNAPIVQRFTEKYKATFNQDPTSLEALAYDAGLLIQKALNKPNTNLSRSDVRDELKRIQNLSGVTGKISYRDGQFFRELPLIQVKSGHFIETHPNTQ